MKTSVGAWNAKAAFGDEQRTEGAIETLKGMDADIVFVSEAVSVESRLRTLDALDALGYDYTLVDRDPRDDRKNRICMMLSRIDTTHETTQLGRRTGLLASAVDLNLHVTGVHLNDRDEWGRVISVEDFVAKSSRQPEGPKILMGDLNAMHGDDVKAGALRVLGRKIKQNRLTGMAEGETLDTLEEAGFHDADPQHRATFQYGLVPIAQLDHIFHNDLVNVRDFRLGNQHGSDHRPIVATIEV